MFRAEEQIEFVETKAAEKKPIDYRGPRCEVNWV